MRFYPDKVIIFTEKTYHQELDKATTAIEVLSNEFGFNPEIDTHIMSDWDFLAAGKDLFMHVKSLKTKAYEVAIDITPGRKPIVVAALITGIKIKVDHVFYLAIKSTKDAAKPYMMIPLQIQQIRDFMDDAKQVVS